MLESGRDSRLFHHNGVGDYSRVTSNDSSSSARFHQSDTAHDGRHGLPVTALYPQTLAIHDSLLYPRVGHPVSGAEERQDSQVTVATTDLRPVGKPTHSICGWSGSVSFGDANSACRTMAKTTRITDSLGKAVA